MPSKISLGQVANVEEVGVGLVLEDESLEGEMADYKKQAAAFLDRDGTINLDKGYFYRPEEFVAPDVPRAANLYEAVTKYILG